MNVNQDRTMDGLRAGFLQFAGTVFSGTSAPLYRNLSLGIAGDDNVLAMAAPAQIGQYPPYVLFAAVQYLLMANPNEPLADFYASLRDSPRSPKEAFPFFQEFCRHHESVLTELVSRRLVQTHEVGRTACLVPAFAYVANLAGDPPLHLIDVGAAAGLNLLFDQYRLDYGSVTWGDENSRVQIPCELKSDSLLPVQVGRQTFAIELAWI